jgi:fumarylacetoacetate (FAA) hydrolase
MVYNDQQGAASMSTQLKRQPLTRPIGSIRDFYAFEQHVKTCRAQRGLAMPPAWYEIPAFYFSNPLAIIGDGDEVWAPQGSIELDFELEIACVIDKEVSDLPAYDRALDCVAGFTIMNDWSARDLQRAEMTIGLGPAKGKDFATSLGPRITPFSELRDCYREGRLHLEMTASVNGKAYSKGNAGAMFWTWPQILAHASRDTKLGSGDILGSGTVGTGCILELTPQAVGGWLRPGDLVELSIERLGVLRNRVIERPTISA